MVENTKISDINYKLLIDYYENLFPFDDLFKILKINEYKEIAFITRTGVFFTISNIYKLKSI
ncbi:hypothetical protein A0H76_621 [Hepatospora eriocheir]|uniref:Uncharacterized protein n=1 Tax=Hepatospora eriocheir TaxID=1081669 RepID=A0A1X0Q7Q2_9MICR|nr:hypothetical protein A0H76_621 [Hepatospora eriocheir]